MAFIPEWHYNCFCKYPNLKFLELSLTNVYDERVKDISKIESIVQLNLMGCPITDESAKRLKRMKKIETLDISYTSITDTGLVELADSISLKEIKVSKGLITSMGIEVFQKRNDKARIVVCDDYGGVSENVGQDKNSSNKSEESEE